MVDWKEVAETLTFFRDMSSSRNDAVNAAIALCELAAKLPPGEAERVLEAAVANRQDDNYRRELQAKREPVKCNHLSTYIAGDGSQRCMACKGHA